MAIQPDVQLAPNVTAADANYPYGSSKNETVPGLFDGTPHNKTRADDIFGLQQALLRAAGLVPTGSADNALASQYMQAINALAGGRAMTFNDNGVVNALDLDVRTNQQPYAGLFNGAVAVFQPKFTNTGAVTVDLLGFGVKDIVFRGGVPLVGGELVIQQYSTIIYNSATGKFELQRERQATTILRGITRLATGAETAAGANGGIAVTPFGLTARTATDTRAGLIEIATAAEVAAAADTTRAVTPGRLSSHPSVSKAWVNFNGTGVVAINDEHNVASITDHSTGDYTVNFSSALANADYAVSGTGTSSSFTTTDTIIALRATATGGTVTTKTTGAVRVLCAGFTTVVNPSNLSIIIL